MSREGGGEEEERERGKRRTDREEDRDGADLIKTSRLAGRAHSSNPLFFNFTATTLTFTSSCTACWTPAFSLSSTAPASSSCSTSFSPRRTSTAARAGTAPQRPPLPAHSPVPSHSRHVSSYLIAAFVKKLARLSLQAPPAGIVVCMSMVYNLMKRHPVIKTLAHKSLDGRKGSGAEAQGAWVGNGAIALSRRAKPCHHRSSVAQTTATRPAARETLICLRRRTPQSARRWCVVSPQLPAAALPRLAGSLTLGTSTSCFSGELAVGDFFAAGALPSSRRADRQAVEDACVSQD